MAVHPGIIQGWPGHLGILGYLDKGVVQDGGVVHIGMHGVILSTEELRKFLAKSRHYCTF